MVVSIVLAGVLAAQGVAGGGSLPQDLRRAAEAYDAAQAVGDRDALERLLADDYLLIDGAGASESKAELIKDFTDPAFHLEPYTVEHAVERAWANGAMLGGEVHLHGTSAGKPFKAHTRFVDVWTRRQGRWQVVFTQVTRFPAGS